MPQDTTPFADRQTARDGNNRRATGSAAGAPGRAVLRPCHERILEAFSLYGPMVPDELAERIGRSALYVRPRCSELRAMGLLRATGESRRNATSGLSAVVLAIVTSP